MNIVSVNTPTAAEGVVKDHIAFLDTILTECKYSGDWRLKMKTQVKSNTRFRVRHFDRDSIEMRVMPGDSGTCWECSLLPPKTENALVVGRELTLWNGYNGKNVPSAFRANIGYDDGEDTPIDVETIGSKIVSAEKLAKAYADREREISKQEAEVSSLLRKADEAQAVVDELIALREKDEKGRAAADMLASLTRLLQLS